MNEGLALFLIGLNGAVCGLCSWLAYLYFSGTDEFARIMVEDTHAPLIILIIAVTAINGACLLISVHRSEKDKQKELANITAPLRE